MRDAANVPPFCLLSDPALLSARARAVGVEVKITEVSPGEADAAFADSLPVVPLSAAFTDTLGFPDSCNAAGILESVDRAVACAFEGTVSAIVTCPIAKKPLYEAGFKFPGHTEYLAHLAAERTGKAVTPVMMLAGPNLRTVPVTIHIALADVPAALTTDAIVTTAHIAAAELASRFGIARPRLASAAAATRGVGRSAEAPAEDQ